MKRLLVILAALVLLAAPVRAEQQGSHYDAIAYTGKSADFSLTLGSVLVYLGGWTIRESAGSAAVATVIIRNGSDTDSATGGVQCAASGGSTQVGGEPLVFIEVNADGSAGENYSLPIAAPKGLCADVVAGTVDITIYLER